MGNDEVSRVGPSCGVSALTERGQGASFCLSAVERRGPQSAATRGSPPEPDHAGTFLSISQSLEVPPTDVLLSVSPQPTVLC